MGANAVSELEINSNPKLKILVVDDDQLNQRMMRLILTREGHDVSIASNGQEAIDLVRVQDFDIILMDLQMPILDGLDASRRIREWEGGRRHTFIVALTASFLPEKGNELFSAGVDNYISKPFDLEHLRQILRYSYGSRRIPDQTPGEEPSGARDLDIEAGIHRVGGIEETYRELLEEFVRELPVRLDFLQTCFLSGNHEKLARGAHNLKGVSANLGGLQLSEHASRLEKQADASNVLVVRRLLEVLQTTADRFKTEASDYLGIK